MRGAAFTLAEVLITLGIIGVVAALTLPTLISNYKNQVYVNKLKKMVSLLENGIRKAAADEDTDVKNSEFYKLFNAYSCESANVCDDRVEAISKYFKVLGSDTNNYKKNKIHGGEKSVLGNIILADGSAIISEPWEFDSTIAIDINADKKPNTYGRDYFEVRVDTGGLIHDADDCNIQEVAYSYDGNYDNGGIMYVYEVTSCGLCKDKLANNPDYDGCYLYRIQSNGWKMDY